MSEVAKRRWSMHEQSEEETRQYFETEDLDVAMEAYQRLRKIYEAAGQLLDKRFQALHSEEKCSHCGKAFDRNTPWYHRESKRDPRTGGLYNEFACCQTCMIAVKGGRQASGLMRA